MATIKTPDNKDALRILATVPPPIDLASVPMPSEATISAIAKEVNLVVSKAVAAQAAELQSTFEATQALQIAHNTDGARAAFRDQQSRMENDATTDKDISKRDAWSQEDWAEDFQLKFLAYREQTFRLSQAAHKLSLPLAQGFAEKATLLADKLEALEIETADRFCTRHIPSDATLSVRKLADHILQSAAQFYPRSGASPRSLFSHLPVFETTEK
jgi:hypothetical protein